MFILYMDTCIVNLRKVHTVFNTMYMLYRSWAHWFQVHSSPSPVLLCVSGGLAIAEFSQAARSPGFQPGSASEKHWTGGRERPGCLSPRKPSALLWFLTVAVARLQTLPQRPAVVPSAISDPSHWALVTPSPLIFPGLEVTSHCH